MGITSFDILDTSTFAGDPWSGPYTLAFDPISTKSEGDQFNLRVTSTGLAPGTNLYFKFSGDIDQNDIPGTLVLSEFEIDNDGKLDFGITLANDQITEGTETALIEVYSDSERNNLVGITSFDILDTSTFVMSEKLALNYIASNPDLISAFGINIFLAISHYENYGISENRSLTTFNASGYLAKYSDLSAAFGNDETLALKHYIQNGYSEGRTDSSTGSSSSSGSGPNSGSSSNLTDFQALQYIASHNDLITAFGIDTEAAKSHFTNYGEAEGRSLTIFSASVYLTTYSDLSVAFGNDQTLALKHYIQYGYSEGRTISSSSSGSGSNSGTSSNLTDFQALQYIASHNDLIAAFGTDTAAAKSHYTNFGKSEGRTLDDFDEWGYLASNNDLISSIGIIAVEAVKHYISFGYSLGKSTNSFDAQSYLNNYADLRSVFGNDQELATKHYVEYGFNEGRLF